MLPLVSAMVPDLTQIPAIHFLQDYKRKNPPKRVVDIECTSLLYGGHRRFVVVYFSVLNESTARFWINGDLSY